MLIRDGNNIFCTFRVKTAPEYVEKSKSGKTFMKCRGFTRASEADGETNDLEYELVIMNDAAIPASKTILPGALLLVGGRTAPREYFRRDTVTIFVDFWFPVVRDPYHYTDILGAQMQMLAAMHLGNFYQALPQEEKDDVSDA